MYGTRKNLQKGKYNKTNRIIMIKNFNIFRKKEELVEKTKEFT